MADNQLHRVLPFEIKELEASLRTLLAEDLCHVKELIEKLGWLLAQDIDCHFQIGPKSFFGLFDGDGQLITVVLLHPVDESSICLGVFITREEARGKGVGKQLLSHITQKLQDKNITLVAVETAKQFYEKLGFVASPVGSHRILRIVAPKALIQNGTQDGVEIRAVTSDSDIEMIAKYDQSVTQLHRLDYLRTWLLYTDCHTMIAVKGQGECVGYGGFRDRKTYVKMQPLFADSSTTAIAIINAFLSLNRGSVEVLRFSVINEENKSDFCEKLKGFGEVERAGHQETFMFTQEDILAKAVDRIFTITNTETAPF